MQICLAQILAFFSEFASQCYAADQAKRSTSGSYAPGYVDCIPSGSSDVSVGFNLSKAEQNYLHEREILVLPAIKRYLDSSGLESSAYKSLSNDNMPRIGIGFSGGGFRAMLNSAGFMKALDERSGDDSALGGILQSALYITALSGGSWTLGTAISNEMETIDFLIDRFWGLEHGIITTNASDPSEWTITYLKDVIAECYSKKNAGFPMTYTDFWGRIIQTFTNPAISLTMSDITKQLWFQKRSFPFPIITSNYVNEDKENEMTLIEMSPYDFGSAYPVVHGRYPIKFLGTTGNKHIEGFDNFGFVLASSSSIFTLIKPDRDIPKVLLPIYNLFTKAFSAPVNAAIWPNPFKGANTSKDVNDLDQLTLTDGGFNGQDIPIFPLLNLQRNLDVLFVSDSASNTDDLYTDGGPIYNSYNDYIGLNMAGDYGSKTLPPIPDTDTFIAKGLNKRNVFFGIDEPLDTPIAIYFPNREVTYPSNTSTTMLSYPNAQRDGIIKNGYDLANNLSKKGSDYSVCIACAMTERMRQRAGDLRPDVCKKCYLKYGYNS